MIGVCAVAWSQAAPRPAAPAKQRVGYLTAADTPDVAKIVPPAPTTGDSRDLADRAIFKATRSFEGTPRWTMAASDNNLGVAAVMKAFSCSLGVDLTPQKAPNLAAWLTKATNDGTTAFTRLKDLNEQRKRPFLVEEGSICLANPGGLATNPDYPSGHTTFGWQIGMMLAEIAADKSTEVLNRGRAYGESRVVCGVHNASAVEAGRMVGSAIFAAQHGSAAYRADAELARTELAGLRATASVQPESCKLELDLLSRKPY